MDRRHLAAATVILVLSLTAFGLWSRTRDSSAARGSSTSTDNRHLPAALGAIAKRGLAEGGISASRQWNQFSGVESVAGGMPPQTRVAVAETVGGRASLDTLGLEFGSAHRATTPSGITLWMIPGPSVMCLVRAERLAIACSSKQKAVRRGLVLQIHRSSDAVDQPTFSAIGIVPDWATGISLQAGSVPVTLPIQANAFDFTATRSIRVVRLTR